MTDLTKARFGFLTAQLIGFTLAGVAASHLFLVVRSHRAAFCGALGFIGLVEAFVRRVRQPEGQRAGRRKDAQTGRESEKHPFAPVFNLSSTGLVTVIAAVAIYVAAAATHRVLPQVPLVAAPNAGAIVFPQLELQGLVHSGAHPTAVIQGRTVTVGDCIENVQVVAIGREGVTLELAGQRTVLRWEDRADP